MSAVDPLYAQWLMAETLWAVSADVTLAGRWGSTGQTTERATTIANKADALAEAARQIAFLSGGGPLVIDEHQLLGEWCGYLGRVITITGDHLGYDAGLAVFVVGVQDDPATGLSTVTVIRRL
jgi:hypothetical protein